MSPPRKSTDAASLGQCTMKSSAHPEVPLITPNGLPAMLPSLSMVPLRRLSCPKLGHRTSHGTCLVHHIPHWRDLYLLALAGLLRRELKGQKSIRRTWG